MFYLIIIEDNANTLSYATFFGGNLAAEHVDGGTSRFDRKGVVYQSVCAGCGGFSIGLNKSGYEVKISAEIDKYACETLKLNENYHHSEILNCDLTTISGYDFGSFEVLDRVPKIVIHRFFVHFCNDNHDTRV